MSNGWCLSHYNPGITGGFERRPISLGTRLNRPNPGLIPYKSRHCSSTFDCCKTLEMLGCAAARFNKVKDVFSFHLRLIRGIRARFSLEENLMMDFLEKTDESATIGGPTEGIQDQLYSLLHTIPYNCCRQQKLRGPEKMNKCTKGCRHRRYSTIWFSGQKTAGMTAAASGRRR